MGSKRSLQSLLQVELPPPLLLAQMASPQCVKQPLQDACIPFPNCLSAIAAFCK